jgi:hypothetical protein
LWLPTKEPHSTKYKGLFGCFCIGPIQTPTKALYLEEPPQKKKKKKTIFILKAGQIS